MPLSEEEEEILCELIMSKDPETLNILFRIGVEEAVKNQDVDRETRLQELLDTSPVKLVVTTENLENAIIRHNARSARKASLREHSGPYYWKKEFADGQAEGQAKGQAK